MIMKWFTGLMLAINLFLGVKCLLNALNILHDSKLSQGATVTLALVFLSMGAGGFLTAFMKCNDKLALLISLGPWILGFLFVFVSMLTSDYK